jgi:hypothetical protein
VNCSYVDYSCRFLRRISATRIHTCPLLFPIFINDIVDAIQCNIRLFADDTSLHSVVEDAYEAAIKLNTDTEKIYE